MTKFRIKHHWEDCGPKHRGSFADPDDGCIISLEPLQDDQKIIEGGLERCLCKQGDGLMAVQEPAVHSPTSCGPKPEDEKHPVVKYWQDKVKEHSPQPPQDRENDLKEFRRKYEGANYWTTVSTPMIEDMLKDIRTLLEKTREEEKKKWHDVAHDEYARGQADSYEICADIAKQSLLAKLKENVERMKNVNEMVKMDGQKYTMGYEKARKDILKLIKTLE